MSKRSSSGKLPTQAEVAALAKVSQEAVSHILGGKRAHLFSKETQERVRKAAATLGYQPHRGAQIMRKGRSNLIIFLNMGAVSENVSKRAFHVGRLVHEAGFDYQTIDAYWWIGDGNHIIQRVIALRPEGIVISGSVQSDAMDFSLFERAGIPLVSMGFEVPGYPRIRYDAEAAFCEITTACLEQGRQRLALLLREKHPGNDWQREARQAGFLQALRKAKLPAPQEFEYPARPRPDQDLRASIFYFKQHAIPFQPFEAGSNAAKWIDTYPDALICSNDYFAAGALSHYLQRGIPVPEQIAISGFDNVSAGVLGPIPLSTVEQPTETMCAGAVEALLALIRGKKSSPLLQVFPCQIIWRASMPARETSSIQPTTPSKL